MKIHNIFDAISLFKGWYFSRKNWHEMPGAKQIKNLPVSLEDWENLAPKTQIHSENDILHIDKMHFKDPSERTILFRGVNLSAKNPQNPYGASYMRKNFYQHKEVSFVGRPFPLNEAREHFARLSYWGINLLRWSVHWEAVEHAGPGQYDQEYLTYLKDVIAIAKEYGLHVFIDFHQDVWSRFTGGDGAPGWTLEMAGFSLENLEETGACILHDIQNSKYQHITWPTNAYKLAAATMFTLFFGGNAFAPKMQVQGESIQDFYQRHYINMVKQVVHTLKDMPHVLGYGLMNEPQPGYIGCQSLHETFGFYKFGNMPTPLQSMFLGDGHAALIDTWDIKRFFCIKKIGKSIVNPSKKRAWQNDRSCIWKEHGVWETDQDGRPTTKNPEYFRVYKGKKISFSQDFYKPFLQKLGTEIQKISPQAFLFIENVVGKSPPKFKKGEMKNLVFTGHWYDSFVLVTKRFLSWLAFDMIRMKGLVGFPRKIRKSFAKQIAHLKNFGKEHMGNVPTLISEFGVPLDLHNKKAYENGNFSIQNQALNRSYTALDDNMLSATLWNYTHDNSNVWGDHWNSEDLSIFSKDQHFDTLDSYSGLRVKEAFVRPYVQKVSGEPLRMEFCMHKRRFSFAFKNDPTVKGPTCIFLPHLHFKEGFSIYISDGNYEMDYASQTLLYYPTNKRKIHQIHIFS